MTFERPQQPTRPEESPKKEMGGFEAWLTLVKATAVLGHFCEQKQGEIRAVVEQVREGNTNPTLIGDKILNAVSKFGNIVADYNLEAERYRAIVQQNTIDNVNSIRSKAEEAEKLRQQRIFREADLHRTLHGKDGEDVESDIDARDRELSERFNKIDINGELSAEERQTLEDFKNRLEEQLRDWRNNSR